MSEADTELNLGQEIYPIDLEVDVRSVHYADKKDVGAFIRVKGDLSHIIDADESINLFLDPAGFKKLLHDLFEALMTPYDNEVAESGIHNEARWEAQLDVEPDWPEGLE